MNNLTLPYFNSFCQLFHIPFFYNIFTSIRFEMIGTKFTAYFIIFQCLVKRPSGKT